MRLFGLMVTLAALTACEREHDTPPRRPAPPAPLASGSGSVATSCVPGFEFAVFGVEGVTFSGNGHTDSYDDHVSPVTESDSNAGICTDSASSGAISLSGNATIYGNACVGVGGTAGSPTINTSGKAAATSESVQSTNTTMTPVTIPSVGSNAGSVDCSSLGSNGLTANETYGAVTCSGKGTLTLSAGTYVMTSLKLSGGSTLNVKSGSIVVYLTSSLDLSGGTVANASMIAGNLVFMGGPSCTSVAVSGGASSSFAVYAPAAAVTISGNGDIYGAVVGATVTDSGNGAIHYDTELANLTPAGFSCNPSTSTEVARATPIIATIGGVSSIVQGTEVVVTPTPALPQILVDSDAAKFSFPAIKGHMYALPASYIGTTAEAVGSAGATLDAAAHIPAANYAGCGTAFMATCRTVFTTTTTGRWPVGGGGSASTGSYTFLQSSNRGALTVGLEGSNGALAGSSLDTLLTDVVTGQLGGVDHSAVAVIGPSNIALSVANVSGGARPTMIYFGAGDGMLHAICAQAATGTGCDVAGRELWAFLARTQQGVLRLNTQSIEGSPHVADAFGDFYGTGAPSFKTVLTLHTGTGIAGVANETPAVYALDITDPTSPRVLWEYTTPNAASPREYELGQGLTLAMGNVRSANGYLQAMTFAETNNAGKGSGIDGGGSAAAVVVALDTATGTEVWVSPFGFPYARGAHGDSPAVPRSGIPGGAVGVDKLQNGTMSDLVFGDLYGNVWEIDPFTGSSRYGANTPLFTPSTIEKPIGAAPAIYSDGIHQFAAFATGGYVDFSDTGSASNLWSAGTQMVFSVNLSSSVGSLNEESTSTTNGVPNVPFYQALAAGQSGFAQLAVVGSQLFLTTDGTDVNSSGYGVHGATGQTSAITVGSYGVLVVKSSPVTVGGGAAAVAFSGTSVYASNSSQIRELPSATSSTGPGVEPASFPKGVRLLFLRTE